MKKVSLSIEDKTILEEVRIRTIRNLSILLGWLSYIFNAHKRFKSVLGSLLYRLFVLMPIFAALTISSPIENLFFILILPFYLALVDAIAYAKYKY
ncbi:MAG: hypothetical protein ABIM30_05965 [candidate division WOR-3 bacterium]